MRRGNTHRELHRSGPGAPKTGVYTTHRLNEEEIGMRMVLWCFALSIVLGGCQHRDDAYWGSLAKGVGQVMNQE